MSKVVEGKFFDVTVEPKRNPLGNERYYLVQADSAEEAARIAGEFGEVQNVRKPAVQTVILKGDK